jgi:peptide/nickel transport system substrate-binding protein
MSRGVGLWLAPRSHIARGHISRSFLEEEPVRLRKALACVAAGVISAAVVAGCSNSNNSSSGTGPGAASTTGTPVNGGTATFAELPGTPPNYIFPFTSSSYISVSNTDLFQYLLYRPLYWFGTGSNPTVNSTLSVANPPVWSADGKTMTITLKHYMWSNGQPVSAQNVMFWLNMELQDGTDYGAYTGFPGAEVSSMKAVNATTLTVTFKKEYNHDWVLYNDLSEVTPMPEAWDVTASGPSHCSTVPADCTAVYKYLNGQSTNMNSWASSPLWSIVDGPWKLSQFNTDGYMKLVPNSAYTGPQKPHLAAFEELPYTSDASEYSVLRSPSGGSTIDVGYIPSQNLPAKPAGAAIGGNPVSGYTLDPWYQWGISFYTINEQSTVGDHGAIFRQLYFRQAVAYLMNQEAVIAGPLRGYGFLTTGPVTTRPVTSWLSSQDQTDPFPYNPAKAKALLTSHGWNVVPNGTTTCVNPSLCGPGITKGSGLSFTMAYASGTAWIADEMTQLQANEAPLGIKLNLKPEPFTQVVDAYSGNCKVASLPCNYDMADWGLGWSYYPDVEPTGETLFLCGDVANSGAYCDKTNDAMIEQTLSSSSDSLMYTWENYLTQQLPVEWQPNAPYQDTEVINSLHGVIPQEDTLNITPEYWYFVKS